MIDSAVINGVNVGSLAPDDGFFKFFGPSTTIQPITQGTATYALPFTFSGQLFYPGSVGGNPPPPCTFCQPDLTGFGTAVITVVPGGFPGTAMVTGETYYFGVTSVPEPGTFIISLLGLGLAAVLTLRKYHRVQFPDETSQACGPASTTAQRSR